jgi:hypothetical protein
MAGQANIEVNIGANNAELNQGLNQARESVRDWAGNVEGHTAHLFKTPHINLLHLSRGLLTAFSVGGVIEGIKSLVKESVAAGEAAEKMADKLGVSLAQYDLWKEKADEVGMSLEHLDSLLARMEARHFTPAEISEVLGTDPTSPGNTVDAALQEREKDEKKKRGFWGSAGDLMSSTWYYGGALVEDLVNSGRNAVGLRGWKGRNTSNFSSMIQGTYKSDDTIAKEEAEKKLADTEPDYENKKRLSEWQWRMEEESHEKEERIFKEKEQQGELDAREAKETALRFAEFSNVLADSAAHEDKGFADDAKKKARLADDIDRIRVPGGEATGLGAIGGYSGASMDKGAMAATQRQQMIEKLEKIAANTEE